MKANEVIAELVSRSSQSMCGISRALSRADNYIYELKRQNVSPKADTLAAIANACGYSLALIPTSEELPAGAIVIDRS